MHTAKLERKIWENQEKRKKNVNAKCPTKFYINHFFVPRTAPSSKSSCQMVRPLRCLIDWQNAFPRFTQKSWEFMNSDYTFSRPGNSMKLKVISIDHWKVVEFQILYSFLLSLFIKFNITPFYPKLLQGKGNLAESISCGKNTYNSERIQWALGPNYSLLLAGKFTVNLKLHLWKVGLINIWKSNSVIRSESKLARCCLMNFY